VPSAGGSSNPAARGSALAGEGIDGDGGEQHRAGDDELDRRLEREQVHPVEMEPITTAPSSAVQTAPRPPNRLVPATTGPAIARSSRLLPPDDWLTARSREASMIPPTAAMLEASMNTITRTLLFEMPARLAASALPPTAKM
jgi:hypothetical protein